MAGVQTLDDACAKECGDTKYFYVLAHSSIPPTNETMPTNSKIKYANAVEIGDSCQQPNIINDKITKFANLDNATRKNRLNHFITNIRTSSTPVGSKSPPAQRTAGNTTFTTILNQYMHFENRADFPIKCGVWDIDCLKSTDRGLYQSEWLGKYIDGVETAWTDHSVQGQVTTHPGGKMVRNVPPEYEYASIKTITASIVKYVENNCKGKNPKIVIIFSGCRGRENRTLTPELKTIIEKANKDNNWTPVCEYLRTKYPISDLNSYFPGCQTATPSVAVGDSSPLTAAANKIRSYGGGQQAATVTIAPSESSTVLNVRRLNQAKQLEINAAIVPIQEGSVAPTRKCTLFSDDTLRRAGIIS